MKKLLFFFILLTSLSKAQNDSIMFFAYTDYNNNCMYEPGMGEEPLNHFTFDFAYKFTTSFIQSNTKTTDSNGNIKFYAPSAFAPASNTISISSCQFAGGPPQFSTCFTNQNLPYNTTYSVGVYSPMGPPAFNFFVISDFIISTYGQLYNTAISTPGYKFFCIGKSVLNASFFAYNYTGNNMSFSPMTLSFQGGSSDMQVFTNFTNYNATGCASGGGGYSGFVNPELQIPGIYTVTLNAPGVNAPTYTNTFVLVVDSCESVNGNVFVDCNANCYQDGNEYNCDEEVITSTNGTYSTTVIPDYNGNYSIVTPYSATQYTATITPNVDFALACSTPSVVTYLSNTSNANFFTNTINQTAVNNINYSSYVHTPYSGSSVPGGNFKFRSYYDVAKPDFCSTLNNAGSYYVKLDLNTQLVSVDPGTPNYTAIYPTTSGDSIVWTLADLRAQAMNLGGHDFVLNIYMLPTATIGLPYTITSGVLSNVTETTLLDNRRVGTWLIGGPFDPNYIEVTPKGTGVQGYIPTSTTELYYTINFQNVGNAPAIDVKVKNLLDANLDASSIKILGSSDAVQTNIDANGLVTFMFNHIMLADSTHDEPNSHGFVSYKINLKPSLAVGTQIHNTAAIYFDYNAAVLTNTVLNTLQTTTGVHELNSSSFAVYPNPSNGLVTVSSTDMITKVVVINVLGEVMKSMTTDSKQVVVDITDLKSSVYFLQITNSKNQTSIQKIVKE
jgi:hypothetical protein